MSRRSVLVGIGAVAALPARVLALAPAGTAASAIPVTVHMRGARVPTGLSSRIHAQNASAAALNKTLQADTDFRSTVTGANPRAFTPTSSLPRKFDWRDSNRITLPKDQGACGSCWAFAAVAAYESAYLIANQIDAVKDGTSVLNVSEQEALDCAFVEDDCVLGGWHEVVFLYLQLQGAVSGAVYSYHGAKGFCSSNLSARPYYVLNWGYVSDQTPTPNLLPADSAIKQAIYRYGAVASSVTTEDWDKYTKTDVNGSPNTHWSTDFPNGVFVGKPNSSLKVSDIDHEVAIIGWDDDLSAWLIKNSWGTDWGDGGYMKLKYQSNYIGFGSSWVTVSPVGSVTLTLENSVRAVTEGNLLRKKFYPNLKIRL